MIIYMSKKTSKSTEKINKYLEGLTKEELITLIVKFAPQTFLDTIDAQSANKSQATKIYSKVSQEINVLFTDEELLYSPKQFEHELLEKLEKIRGLWDKIPAEIGDLILEIMENVEQAFEDGYLYIEKYGQEDDYFESKILNEYIARFFNNLPSDLQSSYIGKLKDVLEGFGYSTFLSIEDNLFTQ